MGCRSKRVQKVAQKTVDASEQIQKLEEQVQHQETNNRHEFQKNIKTHLESAQITDAIQLIYQSNIKVEYQSEFSLDGVVDAVTTSLKALSEIPRLAKKKSDLISMDSINTYRDVVTTIAESAKSSSAATTNSSFAMNRLGPGIFIFLYASSSNIKNTNVFGSEAITATGIYYQVIQSETDLKTQASFSLEKARLAADLDSYDKFIGLQAKLLDRLVADEIDLEAYEKLDEKYTKHLAEIKTRIKGEEPTKVDSTFMNTRAALVQASIEQISATNNINYAKVVDVATTRLEHGYF